MRNVHLTDLGQAVGARVNGDAVVTGLTYDSRRVRPGDLFCAIPGFKTDGHRYVSEARQYGAVACLVENAAAIPEGMPALIVKHSRSGTAKVAAEFYGHPSRELWMIGVTGTNGKTTTTHLVRCVLERAGGGMSTGLTGTVHTLIGRETWPVERTTPEAPDLQATLRQMVDNGMKATVMEVSSHALILNRVDEVFYDVGIFTNLTQDHLDFHRDFEDYFAAKARLFEGLGQGPSKGPQAAILNADDPWAARLIGRTTASVLTYGIFGGDVHAEDIHIDGSGASFTVHLPNGDHGRIDLPMSGRFNVSNALAAISVGYLQGLSVESMAQALTHLGGVPGRFEIIDCGQPFAVIVDYAHSPDGLENVLNAAREFVAGRLTAVFGAGGDRDRSKRSLMGAAAGRLADDVVLTSDNPRSENPESILRDIEIGVREVGGHYLTEPDRAKAIRLAVHQAKAGDAIVVAGKGHEDYQIFRDRTIHFDDREEVRRALGELGYRCQ